MSERALTVHSPVAGPAATASRFLCCVSEHLTVTPSVLDICPQFEQDSERLLVGGTDLEVRWVDAVCAFHHSFDTVEPSFFAPGPDVSRGYFCEKLPTLFS